MKDKLDGLAEEIATGKISINEARVRVGLDPRPDPAFDMKVIAQEKIKGDEHLMGYEKRELEPFLPTAQEIRNMDKETFGKWVRTAKNEIPSRNYQRDPLFKLNERIAEILDSDGTDADKEICILDEINWHYEHLRRLAKQS